jgi:prepilin-type N-terminal cleavage/methylation domain-containing protein
LQIQNTWRGTDGQAGFTLIETLVVMLVLMVASGMVMQATINTVRSNETITNRANMHAGVRNATALLQQEVGQAGRVTLPAPATLAGAVGGAGVSTVGVTSTAGMFDGERLVIDTGANEETVTLTAVDRGAATMTASFAVAHVAGARVAVLGGFSAGVIPTTMANGSTGTLLKIVGDINGDGNMVYVEYTCDLAQASLFRNSMPITAALKPMPTVSQVLLNNIQPNPDGSPCFTYQEQTVSGMSFVTDVAITLTVQTERRDPVTGLFQQETKALLNVSPRNVFQVWQLASMNMSNRVQSVPASVTNLLP